MAVVRLGRLKAGPASAVDSGSGSLRAEAERIDRLAADLAALAARIQTAEVQGRRAVQRIGVVRYNPFADTGSNQSFALALLDARGDGFVLSSLHSRQQTRVFLKAVAAGTAETALSDEEAQAITQAMATSLGT